MSGETTLPLKSKGRPVRGIRAEVVDGQGAGLVATAEGDRLAIGTADGNELVLPDKTVSRFHATLTRAGHRIRVTDHGSTNGTMVGPALVKEASVDVEAGTTLVLGGTRVRIDDGDVHFVEPGPAALGELRGRTAAMRQLMATAQQVAVNDVPVLLLGESGTGKELLARAIHDVSPRAEHPFITVDCAALSPTLFASTLFGHERGAFTGADRRHIGAFERANGGTVFWDELGELPMEQQAALLGVLERRRMTRVGGVEEIPVNVRIVSATHRDLHAEVNAGTFRLDLFYRLAVVRLQLPPLRERREDIPLLVESFLADAGAAGSLEALFPPAALEGLARHSWPGNVRELRNVVLGTMALGKTQELGPSAVPTGGPEAAIDASLPYKEAKRRVLDHFEREYLGALLDKSSGNIRQAARDARMDRKYLAELLKRHGLR